MYSPGRHELLVDDDASHFFSDGAIIPDDTPTQVMTRRLDLMRILHAKEGKRDGNVCLVHDDNKRMKHNINIQLPRRVMVSATIQWLESPDWANQTFKAQGTTYLTWLPSQEELEEQEEDERKDLEVLEEDLKEPEERVRPKASKRKVPYLSRDLIEIANGANVEIVAEEDVLMKPGFIDLGGGLNFKGGEHMRGVLKETRWFVRRIKWSAEFSENMELENFPFDVQDLCMMFRCSRGIHRVQLIPEIHAADYVRCDAELFPSTTFNFESMEIYFAPIGDRRELKEDGTPRETSYFMLNMVITQKYDYWIRSVFMPVTFFGVLTLATFHFSAFNDRLNFLIQILLVYYIFVGEVTQELPHTSYYSLVEAYMRAFEVMTGSVFVWQMSNKDLVGMPEDRKANDFFFYLAFVVVSYYGLAIVLALVEGEYNLREFNKFEYKERHNEDDVALLLAHGCCKDKVESRAKILCSGRLETQLMRTEEELDPGERLLFTGEQPYIVREHFKHRSSSCFRHFQNLLSILDACIFGWLFPHSFRWFFTRCLIRLCCISDPDRTADVLANKNAKFLDDEWDLRTVEDVDIEKVMSNLEKKWFETVEEMEEYLESKGVDVTLWTKEPKDLFNEIDKNETILGETNEGEVIRIVQVAKARIFPSENKRDVQLIEVERVKINDPKRKIKRRMISMSEKFGGDEKPKIGMLRGIEEEFGIPRNKVTVLTQEPYVKYEEKKSDSFKGLRSFYVLFWFDTVVDGLDYNENHPDQKYHSIEGKKYEAVWQWKNAMR